MQMILLTVMYMQLLLPPFTCCRSGSPQNVMHSSSIIYLAIATHLGIGSVFQRQVLSSSRQWSRGARMTISDHVMYNFRTSTWVNLVTPLWNTTVRSHNARSVPSASSPKCSNLVHRDLNYNKFLMLSTDKYRE